MKTKALTRLNKILLAVLCAVFALSAGLVLAFSLNADGDNVEIKDQYVVGDVLFFPKNQFEVEGKKYTYESFIVKPDGSNVKSERITFDKTGVYTLTYVKEVDGKFYSEEYEINVVAPIFEVTSNRAQAVYHENYVYTAKDDTKGGATVSKDTGMSGISVSLTYGSTFKYNKVIDLREFDPNEPIVSFFATPSHIPYRDMTDITVKLTDVYDEGNTVYYNISALTLRYGLSTWNANATQAHVGTSMSELYGIMGDSVGSGHTWYRYGFETAHSFHGRFLNSCGEADVSKIESPLNKWSDDILVGDQILTMAIDENTGYVYGSKNKYPGHDDYHTSSKDGSFLAANLKDGTVYSSIWKGFTTGEVYLEISCDNYERDTANFFISTLGHEDFSNEYTEGGVIPEITINSGAYGDNAPNASVGKAYPLFDATGRTINGEVPATVAVYYNYDTSNAISVDVDNNAFVPDRAGKYTIIYTVKDSYGHANTKRFDVLAKESTDEFTASLKSALPTALMGEKITLPAVNAENAFGDIIYTITVTKPNGEVVELDGDTYIFDVSGNHTVRYLVTDYVGQTTEVTYTVNATVNGTPLSYDELHLPNYLAKGFTAKFPEYTFYDYSGDTVKKIPATITVKDGSGNHVLSGNTYQVKDASDIEVTYSATINGVTKSLPAKTIKIIDPMKEGSTNKIDVSKFAIPTGNAEVASLSGGARVTSNAKDGGITTYQPIVANGAMIKAQIDKTNNNFNKLTVTLTDAYNSNEQLQVSFVRSTLNEGSMIFYFNGNRTFATVNTTFNNGSVITVKYSNGVMKINISEVSIVVDKYLNGESFNGFSSGLVNVNVDMQDVRGLSTVVISQIGSQSLRSSVQFDNGKPDIAINGTYTISTKPTENFKIFSAISADVIDYNIITSLSVQDPDKNYVVSKDGVELREVPFDREYEIDLSVFGTYSIVYSSKDSKNNEQKLTVTVGVYDFEKPTITIDGKVKLTAKLGDKVEFPKASVIDNVDIDLPYYVYIRRPDQVYLPDYKVTVFDQVGIYKITYLAVDSAGNTTVIEHDVTVTK